MATVNNGKPDAHKQERFLTGKAVVVTGAGRGLGEAVAKAIARAGASVVVNDVDSGPAETVAATIRDSGGKAVAHSCDISVWTQAEGLIERCLDDYGRIDGLVNNAGVHLPKRTWEMDEASVRKTLDINVLGTLACAGRAIKAMREQGFGSIVNTTSGAQMGMDYRPDYSASKGAVSSFTFTAALELQGSGVRVNAISPNAETRMLTDMEQFMHKTEIGWSPPYLPPPDTNVCIHLYLLSDRSRHVNGQILGIRPDGELYVASHFAVLEPTVKLNKHTMQEVAEALENGLVAPAQPLGVVRVQLQKRD